MKIGDLAKRAGVNIQTIRFYERERVMRAPSRTASGYRSYTDRDLQHIVFVSGGQSRRALGATRADIFVQIVWEAGVLSVVGCAMGVGCAWEMAAFLARWAGQPRVFDSVSAWLVLAVASGLKSELGGEAGSDCGAAV